MKQAGPKLALTQESRPVTEDRALMRTMQGQQEHSTQYMKI